MAGPRRKGKNVRDLMPPDVFVQRLTADTKEAAIAELVNVLVIQGIEDLSREKATLDSILEREKVATTAIGNGVAIPHAKSKMADKFGVAVGLSEQGIDFGARDGEDVRVVFLWICPTKQTKEHLALMRALASVAQDEDSAAKLATTRDKKTLFRVLENIPLEPKK